MEKHVKEFNADQFKRLFTVSDLHGQIDQLKAALEAVNFNEDEDLLVLHADFIDRGDKSIQAFHLINKKWVVATRGNHEQLAVDGSFDSYLARQHINNGGEWFYKYDEDSRYIVARELEALPVVLEVTFKGKKYGFVHADVVGNDWDAFKQLVREHPNSRIEPNNILWAALNNRDRFNSYFKHGNEDAIEYVNGVDQVYLGHNVVHSHQKLHNVNYIDTGAYRSDKGGYLTLLELGV